MLSSLWNQEAIAEIRMSGHRYNRILEAIFQSPWAIMPDKLELIIAVIEARQENSADLAAYEAKARPSARRASSIAVLPLYGTVMQRAGVMTDFSGGTSTEQFSQMFRAAMSDPAVDQVVIDIDSPGGSVYGVSELAAEIYDARGTKKIHAIGNSLVASAAYWIGSSADSLSLTPGGEAGSIGVYGAHTEASALDEKMGVKTTLISAGKYKTEGNPYEPLTGEARAAMQQRVDQVYATFVKDVARNRGDTQTAVREGYGQGRVLGAADALKAGLIDKVETLDQMLARLGANSSSVKMPMRADGTLTPCNCTAARYEHYRTTNCDRSGGLSIESRKRRLRYAANLDL